MFAKKLIVIAAAVALAVTHVAATQEATRIDVHIKSHHVKKTNTTDYTMNVDVYKSADEGSNAADPAEGSTAYDDEGAYPSPDGSEDQDDAAGSEDQDDAAGSEDQDDATGSADDDDATGPTNEDDGEGSWGDDAGNYGDDDDVVDVFCDGDDASPMSVEGVEGTFCVSGQACAGVEGACPGPQDGLEFGSYCGTVQSGVLGCLPYTETPFCTGEDESEMSVEGVEGVFCVTGPACAGVDGACPGPQDGLEFGSRCDTVQSGVLGCVPNDAKHHKKGHFAKHPAHYKATHYKPAKVKAATIKKDHKKVVAKKMTVKKVTVKKPVVHKPVVHKKEQPKPQHPKPVEAKKHEVKKVVHAKKVEAKKPVVHKPGQAKKPVVHKKVEAKKPAHKAEHKKPAHKVEHKKVEHKKPSIVVKKVEHKH